MAVDYDELAMLCKRRSEEFNRLEALAHPYAAGERLDKPIDAALRKHSRIVDRLGPEFADLVLGTILLAMVFGSEPARKRFFNKTSYRSPDPEALSALISQPWRFRFFSVEKRIAENFFEILDAETEEKARLFSYSIERLEIKGRPLFLAGFFGDETCLQTFGPVLDLPAFDWRDIETFAKLAAPSSFAVRGVSAVIGQDPLSFLLLAAFSQPRITFKDSGLLVFASSSFRFDEAFRELAYALGPQESVKGGRLIRLQKLDRLDSFANLQVDEKRRQATLIASSVKKYRSHAGKSPLLDYAPGEPDFVASMTMTIAIREILGKEFPGLRDSSDSEGRGATKSAKPESLDNFNAAIQEYFAIKNESTRIPDADLIANRHGVEVGSFRDMVRTLETRLEERFRIEVPGGFEDFLPPPPALRRLLDASIEDCALFKVSSEPELDRSLAERKDEYRLAVPRGTKGGVTLERLGHILERATKDFFGNSARTTLTYSIYLLLEAGGEYRPVADYASELLKTFWQVLIPDRGAEEVASFRQTYSLWVYQVLGSFGIVRLEPEPDREMLEAASYGIRRSPFLESWIERSPKA